MLSKEQEMARTLFHDFAENEVKPLAQEVDETERFPAETVEKMKKLGFMGIPEGVRRPGLRYPDVCPLRGRAFQGLCDDRCYRFCSHFSGL